MSKTYKKFALSEYGEIVDRITGKLTRVKDLIVKNNRVYRKGRLYGYLGKQTKKQIAETKRLADNRFKKRQKAKEKVKIEPVKTSVFKPISVATVRDIGNILKLQKLTGDVYLPEINRLQQEESNLVRSLDARLRDKNYKMTEEQYKQFYEEWKNAKTDKERDDVWKKVHANDPKAGYQYDPEFSNPEINNLPVLEIED